MKLTNIERGRLTASAAMTRRDEERKAAEQRLSLVRWAVERLDTQKALARELGVSRVQVTRWMTGVRPVPPKHIPAIEAIASNEGGAA